MRLSACTCGRICGWLWASGGGDEVVVVVVAAAAAVVVVVRTPQAISQHNNGANICTDVPHLEQRVTDLDSLCHGREPATSGMSEPEHSLTAHERVGVGLKPIPIVRYVNAKVRPLANELIQQHINLEEIRCDAHATTMQRPCDACTHVHGALNVCGAREFTKQRTCVVRCASAMNWACAICGAFNVCDSAHIHNALNVSNVLCIEHVRCVVY
jgi:hypothetical protein